MDINGENEYTFEYVKMPEVKYTVKYLDKATGEPVVVNGKPTPDEVVKTSDAVVTVTFKQITGYAPDAYQKRLVLAARTTRLSSGTSRTIHMRRFRLFTKFRT